MSFLLVEDYDSDEDLLEMAAILCVLLRSAGALVLLLIPDERGSPLCMIRGLHGKSTVKDTTSMEHWPDRESHIC
jgi:hypothetical protein